MPEAVVGFNFNKKERSSLGINFDWSGVWNAGPLKFTQGVDFSCSVFAFQRYCHVRAHQKGMKAKTKKISDSEIAVEFTSLT